MESFHAGVVLLKEGLELRFGAWVAIEHPASQRADLVHRTQAVVLKATAGVVVAGEQIGRNRPLACCCDERSEFGSGDIEPVPVLIKTAASARHLTHRANLADPGRDLGVDAVEGVDQLGTGSGVNNSTG